MDPFVLILCCGLFEHTQTHTHVPVRDPGLVGLCDDDDDDSCLKNSLGFMERWETNAAAS